jgi:hypothetical protein
MTSVQSEQLSHLPPPPALQRYCVFDVTAGRAGVHVTLGAATAVPPSTGAREPPLELVLEPLLAPLLLPELLPVVDGLVLALLDPLLLPELEPLLPPLLDTLLPELPPSSPADWY